MKGAQHWETSENYSYDRDFPLLVIIASRRRHITHIVINSTPHTRAYTGGGVKVTGKTKCERSSLDSAIKARRRQAQC